MVFSSFTGKPQPINIQPQVDGELEKPNITSALKTNVPLALSCYLYTMWRTSLADTLNKKSRLEHYPLFLTAQYCVGQVAKSGVNNQIH